MLEGTELLSEISALNFWGRTQDIGYTRAAHLDDLERLTKAKNKVIAITGIRRCGKTYLAKQFLKRMIRHGASAEQTLYVNFEDPVLGQYLQLPLLEKIYDAFLSTVNRKRGHSFIVLDEVQNIPGWEKWIRIMIEKKEDVTLIVTGSSSKLLSSELATVLTGRTLELKLYPFSFSEIVRMKGFEGRLEQEIAIHAKDIKPLLLDYLTYGGFPEVVLEDDETLKWRILKGYFEGILFRDIVFRHAVKDSYRAKVLAEISLERFSSLQSANRLRNELSSIVRTKVSPNQVVDLLNFFDESHITFRIPVFSHRIKDRNLYPKKVYCEDSGLVNAVRPKHMETFGRLYENAVACELLREDKEVFYWKDPSGCEADFLIFEGQRVKDIINVSFDVSDPLTMKRELRGLEKAMDEFGLKGATVVTAEFEGVKTIHGKKVKFIPLWKWLLGRR